MFRGAAIAIAASLVLPGIAQADTGTALEPARLWQAWNPDGLILLNLSVLGWFYWRGLQRLWKKAGTGRCVNRGQAAAFFGALFTLFAALMSPLGALSEQLASAHMVQHMLLMVVAAPLFVLGSPGLVLTWGLARPWRPVAGGWRRWLRVDVLQQPWLLWTIYAAALWGWHLPVAYQAALFDPFVHDAQHLTFFGAACLFWRGLFHPSRGRQIQPLMAIVVLFTTSLHATLLGVLMALSRSPWYDVYFARTAAWGFTPLEDQQLAGLIMWMPGCLVYPAAAAAMLGTWLSKRSESTHFNCGRVVEGS